MIQVELRVVRYLMAAALCLIAAALLFRPVSAHTEGKMQLSAEPAGPFKMTVFTSPDPAVPGDIHFASYIFLVDDLSPVLDADVLVSVQRSDGEGTPVTKLATLGDAENKLLFESIIDISEPGIFTVRIGVTHDEIGQGEASFELEVVSEGGFNWLYVIPAALIMGGAAFWILRRRQESST